ncbi:unnamed protein product, partial [Meganyctiphanes norvegica]
MVHDPIDMNLMQLLIYFMADNARVPVFSYKLCHKIPMKDVLHKCGGQLHAKSGGLNTIRLLPLGDKPTQDEVFSSQYVYDCVRHQELLDLNKYRINKTSLYTDDIDVMEILLGNCTWADCTRSGIKHSDVVSDFSDDDDDLSSPKKTNYRGKLKSGRQNYFQPTSSNVFEFETIRHSY